MHLSHSQSEIPYTVHVIKPDFVVSTPIPDVTRWEPGIAADDNGNFIIVWPDNRQVIQEWSKFEIYAQYFDSAGCAIGGNFCINENAGTHHRYHAEADFDQDGNFYITWCEIENIGHELVYPYHIRVRRFTHEGVPIGNTIQVTDELAGNENYNPTIAVRDNGQFMVAWQGNGHIYSRLYDENASPLTPCRYVNDFQFERVQQTEIAVSRSGTYIIVWQDSYLNHPDAYIYGQRFTANGDAVFGNFRIDNETEQHRRVHPAIAMSQSGNFAVSWGMENSLTSSRAILCRLYNHVAQRQGEPFQVNTPYEGASLYLNGSAMAADDSVFVVVWIQDSELYGQLYSINGTALGENFQITNTQCGTNPSVAMCGNRVFSTWWSGRDIWANIVAFGPADTVLAPVFSPAPGTYSASQNISIQCGTEDAVIRYTLDGSDPTEESDTYLMPLSVISTNTIKARAYKDGYISSPIIEGTYTIVESVSLAGSVTWFGGQTGMENVVMTLAGDTEESAQTGNDGNYEFGALPSGVDYGLEPEKTGFFFQPASYTYHNLSDDRQNQDFIGSLYGDVSGNDEIRSYDASLVLRYAVGLDQWKQAERDSTAADVSGNGSVSSFDASLILQYCADILSEFPVSQSHLEKPLRPDHSRTPVLSFGKPETLEETRFLLPVFLENASGMVSMDLRLNYDLNDLNLKTIRLTPDTKDFQSATFVRDGRIRVSLAGIRLLSGRMRLVNLIFETNTESENPKEPPPVRIELADMNEGEIPVQISSSGQDVDVMPDAISLTDNYPNPFNSETVIEYSIPSLSGNSQVQLIILDILGRYICTLVDTEQESGSYRSIWNGKDQDHRELPSGIYFYQLKFGENCIRKKMILLR
ncbi:chitobiase/beta-hexosaminidase C-terminal domain-containing protein [bacterium]|nr:chitobiase/beta-hexosaminidase C-terminal domain-containing protein [bacterium]